MTGNRSLNAIGIDFRAENLTRPHILGTIRAMYPRPLPNLLRPRASLVWMSVLLSANPLHSEVAETPLAVESLRNVRLRERSGILRLALPAALPPGGDLTTGTVSTAMGEIQLNKDLPATPGDAAWIFLALDTQFATQAYLWALPIVAYAEWNNAQNRFGATGTDLVSYTTYEDKLGLLTANPSSAYALAFTDLAETGPLVVEIPAGPLAGGIGDFWQRTLAEIGEGGPDQGMGGKYLLLPPGQKAPKVEEGEYHFVPCSRNLVRIGFRGAEGDPAAAKTLFSQIRLYPHSLRDSPPPTRLLNPGGEKWYAGQPRGIKYWEVLHSALQHDPVDERDRFHMAMLRELGIEKGKPFTTDPANLRILLEGSKSGELIAKTISFSSRSENSRHWSDRRWEHTSLVKNTEQRDDHYDQLLERSARFYETMTKTSGAISTTPGVGSAHVAAYTDKNGAWLDGGTSYQLRIPPQVPAKHSWSVALYDMDTRCFIENETRSADRSSSMDLLKDDDGAITLHFGPTAPEGREKNWVQTVPGRPWFTYFRLAGPLEGYFDKSWVLGDVEGVR